MINFVQIPVDEIDGKYYVANVAARKAIEEAAYEQDWADEDYDEALNKLRELKARKFGFTFENVVLMQKKCGHWEFLQLPKHSDITEDYIEKYFGDDVCTACHMPKRQRDFMSESRRHVKEDVEDIEETIKYELKRVLMLHQDDDKPEDLRADESYLIDLIKIDTDPEEIFEEADKLAMDLEDAGCEEEAFDIWDAIAYWRQTAAVKKLHAQKESKKIRSKRIKESSEQQDIYRDALDELSRAFEDFIFGDDDDDLQTESEYLLDEVNDYLESDEELSPADLDGLFNEIEDFAGELYERGLTVNAIAVWDALAAWKQNN